MKNSPASAAKRFHAILSRWVLVIVYAVVGAAVVALLITALDPYLNDLFAHVRHFYVQVAVLVLILASMIKAGWHRCRTFLNARSFLAFPPVWISAILGFFLVATVPAWSPTDSPSIQAAYELLLALKDNDLARTLAIAIPLTIAAAAFMMAASPVRSPVSREMTSATPTAEPFDLAATRAWIMSDAEIVHPHEDRFNRNEIAVRILRRLTDTPPLEKCPTVALVGPRGSGKSTVARLVEFHAKHESYNRISLMAC